MSSDMTSGVTSPASASASALALDMFPLEANGAASLDMSSPPTADIQGPVATMALPSSLVDFSIYLLLLVLLIVAVIGAFVFLSERFEPVKNLERAIRNAIGIAEYGGKKAGSAIVGAAEKVAGPVVRPLEKAAAAATGTVGAALREIEKDLDPFPHKTSTQYLSPDEADSDIQFAPKAGYCYVGRDRGARTCAYVGKNDTCMSGKVYPTMDVCINPALRV